LRKWRALGALWAQLDDAGALALWPARLRVSTRRTVVNRVAQERATGVARDHRTEDDWQGFLEVVCGRSKSDLLIATRQLAPSALAFECLVDPWAMLAAEYVRRSLRSRAERDAFAAHERDLTAMLATELSGIVARPGFALFAAERDATSPSTRQGCFSRFVARERASGFARLAQLYPCTMRSLAERSMFWVTQTVRLMRRLARDLDAINSLVRPGRCVAQPAKLASAGSDSHNHGQRVIVARWHDGAAVVYKPRSLAPERLFAEMAEWLNCRTTFGLLTVPVISRRQYGWMSYVNAGPCADHDAARRFFERAGAVLAIAHILGLADLHHENVIAAGEHPILIDTEVILRPVLAPSALDQRAAPLQYSDLMDSVMSTGLMPSLFQCPDGSGFIDGGLWARDAAPDRMEWAWRDPNTDEMQRVRASIATERCVNVPQVAGEFGWRRAGHDVERGFGVAMRAILSGRDSLLRKDGPLRGRLDLRTRLVFRPTATYSQLLVRAAAPAFQRSGLLRSMEFDVLARPAVQGWARGIGEVLAAERRALEAGDVPRFWIRSGARTLRDNFGMRSTAFATQSGVASARTRLRDLTGEEIQRQAHFVRVAYVSAQVRASRARHCEKLSLAQHADRIADQLMALRYDDDRGSHWFAVGDARSAGRFLPVDDSLGLGRSGIALFLLEWARHRSGPAARLASEISTAVLDQVLRRLSIGALPVDAAGVPVLGVVTGYGGMLVALDRAESALQVRRSIPAVVQGASELLDANAREWDWYSGSAGLLAACLYIARDNTALIARRDVVRIVDHVIAGVSSAMTCRDHAPQTTGMAHGLLGALLALDRAKGIANSESVTRFVEQLRRRYAVARALHAPGDESLRGGWCSGRAGEALAGDVDAGAALRHVEMVQRDDLCCGNMSAIDALVERSGCDQESLTHARRIATQCADRAAHRDAYGGTPLDDSYFPSMWCGLAGIGYTWLRCEDPKVPSLLALSSQ
jgi:type 2 lantibiotic biosynthesis protein LanM